MRPVLLALLTLTLAFAPAPLPKPFKPVPFPTEHFKVIYPHFDEGTEIDLFLYRDGKSKMGVWTGTWEQSGKDTYRFKLYSPYYSPTGHEEGFFRWDKDERRGAGWVVDGPHKPCRFTLRSAP